MQEDIITDAVKLKQQLSKLQKCKVCGPDKVYGFWIKSFLNIRKEIVTHLNKCLENGKTPEWIVVGNETFQYGNNK